MYIANTWIYVYTFLMFLIIWKFNIERCTWNVILQTPSFSII